MPLRLERPDLRGGSLSGVQDLQPQRHGEQLPPLLLHVAPTQSNTAGRTWWPFSMLCT